MRSPRGMRRRRGIAGEATARQPARQIINLTPSSKECPLSRLGCNLGRLVELKIENRRLVRAGKRQAELDADGICDLWINTRGQVFAAGAPRWNQWPFRIT